MPRWLHHTRVLVTLHSQSSQVPCEGSAESGHGQGRGDNELSLLTPLYGQDFHRVWASLKLKREKLHVHMHMSPKSVAGEAGALWSPPG